MRSYTELITLESFEERFEYLKLGGTVGAPIFGYDRWLNQKFYQSSGWRRRRNKIIIRDSGCDLAHIDNPIFGTVYVHHINPITIDDIKANSPILYDPNNLVCMSYDTHQAITFGSNSYLQSRMPIERSANDTCPWRK